MGPGDRSPTGSDLGRSAGRTGTTARPSPWTQRPPRGLPPLNLPCSVVSTDDSGAWWLQARGLVVPTTVTSAKMGVMTPAQEYACFPKDHFITTTDGTPIAYTVVGDGTEVPVLFVNG